MNRFYQIERPRRRSRQVSRPVWIKIGLAGLMAILLLTRMGVSAAYACTATPSPQPPPTIAERVDQADVVLVGTVIAILNEQSFDETALVQVEQYFKGSAAVANAATIEVAAFGDAAICRRRVTVGERLIFYTVQRADGGLNAHWLTAGEAVAAPTAELVAAITAVTGPGTTPLPNSITPTVTAATIAATTTTPTAVVVTEPAVTPLPPTDATGPTAAATPVTAPPAAGGGAAVYLVIGLILLGGGLALIFVIGAGLYIRQRE